MKQLQQAGRLLWLIIVESGTVKWSSDRLESTSRRKLSSGAIAGASSVFIFSINSFSERRARCRRLITVPTGKSRKRAMSS